MGVTEVDFKVHEMRNFLICGKPIVSTSGTLAKDLHVQIDPSLDLMT